MKSNNQVKVVGIKFNDKFHLEQDVKQVAKEVLDKMPKARDVAKDIKRNDKQQSKFVVQATLNVVDLERLKRTFVIINHTRRLIVQALQRDPKISRDDLKEKILSSLSGIGDEGRVPHLLLDIVHRDIHHLHNKHIKEGSVEYTETTSLGFKDEKFVNNRFTLNYRRNVLRFEDINITLYLKKSLPESLEDSTFFLNVFVDNIASTKNVHVNLFYTPKYRPYKEK